MGRRLAIVVPDETPEAGGNWVYGARLRAVAERLGHTATVSRVSDVRTGADLYHALNARRAALGLKAMGVDPFKVVVTWTGTDLEDPTPLDAAEHDFLGAVRLHTTLDRSAREDLVARYPDWGAPIRWVPPGVDYRTFAPDGDRVPLPHPALLLVGGGRPVKGTHDAIAWVEALRASGIPAALVLLGPARDPAYWRTVEQAVADRPWVLRPGSAPRDQMPRWYRAADIVINTSFTEGVSNALLEAMAAARPVVARDIAGNRHLLEPARAGRLVDGPEAFVQACRDLLFRPEAAAEEGRRLRRWVERHYDAALEQRRWAAIYAEALGGTVAQAACSG
jgi:glycosyltransferase involved in cell wall biosynthesis